MASLRRNFFFCISRNNDTILYLLYNDIFNKILLYNLFVLNDYYFHCEMVLFVIVSVLFLYILPIVHLYTAKVFFSIKWRRILQFCNVTYKVKHGVFIYVQNNYSFFSFKYAIVN